VALGREAVGAEVRLADASRIGIRPIERGDAPLLLAGFAELSEESRYRRFFTPMRELDDRQLAFLTNVDHHDHEALLAIDVSGGYCAGVARFVRVARDAAEPAVVVGDRWQRLGLGTALLEQLTERARAEGVKRFSGVVLAENEEAIGLPERLGAARHGSGPEVHFEIDLSDRDDAGPTLRELLRAMAAGLLAPARALLQREPPDDA
jgi:GNAT superfamily N-acetyltransferase